MMMSGVTESPVKGKEWKDSVGNNDINARHETSAMLFWNQIPNQKYKWMNEFVNIDRKIRSL